LAGPKFLGIFLVAGTFMMFASVVSDLYPEKAWAALLASAPLGLLIMFLLPPARFAVFSFGLFWSNLFSAFACLVVFAIVAYVSFFHRHLQSGYGIVVLGIFLWALAMVLFSTFAVPKLVREWRIPVESDF